MGFTDDLWEQPIALNRLLDRYEYSAVSQALDLKSYRRIVVTGMGGSHFANYYLWRRLTAAGLNAQWMSTDEVLSFSEHSLMPERTLLWISSQSGLSGEVSELISRWGTKLGIDVIAVTNNEGVVPLTTSANYVQLIAAGPEFSVGTKTYTNTVVANDLLVSDLLGEDTAGLLLGYRQAATGISDYLNSDWRSLLAPVADLVFGSDAVVLLGRGASYGTALEGALVLKEAANTQAEGLSAGQFRHGPLELADAKLFTWLLADDVATGRFDRSLAAQLVGFGAKVVTTGLTALPDGVFDVPAPSGPALAVPLLRMIPLQLGSIVVAEALGLEPGVFRNNQKITTGL
jgi:glucosamine--fructose-6-phosphate aminotransferase (isomerizing)